MTPHLFRPSACHLPDYARRRFRSSGWMSHDVDGRSPAPQRVPFWHLASGDPPLGLLSRLTWWKGNTPRPPHLTQAFQAIGNPETSTQSIVCWNMVSDARSRPGEAGSITIEGLALPSRWYAMRLGPKERLPRQKIADSKAIDQNYCCTVCMVVISDEKID